MNQRVTNVSGLENTVAVLCVPYFAQGSSRLKSSMAFQHDLALQNIPLSKQLFKTQPQIENADITSSTQYNLPATRTNKCRALSLQKVELDG
jgi:hypothetical protein